jgi:dihydroorotate dehydrogenase
MLHKIIINAPFGNRLKSNASLIDNLQWKFDIPYSTPIMGTYTLEYRANKWIRMLRMMKTLRYYGGIGAWKNKLGLPNEGIEYYLSKGMDYSDKIVSISARTTQDWLKLLEKTMLMGPLAIELNVSCPNCGDSDDSNYAEVYAQADKLKKVIIVKLPPVRYRNIFHQAMYWGLMNFNCCNTLPTGNGGLSGKPLKPLSLECVEYARDHGAMIIIGTGGITSWEDVKDYSRAGATNFGLATMLMNPLKWRLARSMAKGFHIIGDDVLKDQ